MSDNLALIDVEQVEELEFVHVRAGELVIEEARNTRSYTRLGSGHETEGIAERHDAFTDEQLREDIAAHGLLQPIGVRWLGESFHVMYGYRRVRACLRLSPNYPVPCVVHAQTGDEDRDDFEADAANLRENMNGRGRKPFKLAEGLFRMHGLRPELSRTELGQCVGLSSGYTTNLLRIRKDACPELWRLFVSYGLRFSSRVNHLDMLEIVRLPKSEQIEAWDALIEARADRKKKKKRRTTAYCARSTTIRQWVVEIEKLPVGPEYAAGIRHALRAVLGEERWGGRTKRKTNRRGKKKLDESVPGEG